MLQSVTDPRWLPAAVSDPDRLLGDLAHAEKKAAAQALSLVSADAGRARLVRQLSSLAIEELGHFQRVHAEILRRGGALGPDPGDPYVQTLRREIRHGSPERSIDRLLVAGLIEARSHERLSLLAESPLDASLRALFSSLARAEAGHARIFVELAAGMPGPTGVRERLTQLALREAEILAALPLEPRIH
ncbi:MAG: tRNA isopentenyl-2-thiomethyl-A-37 hydroxylase MiaE [Myxococcota bacterium]